MAIRKVARMGHPVLRTPAREVSSAEIRSGAMRRLVRDMRETMEEYTGVGLAAPQIHESLRLAVIEFDAGDAARDLDLDDGSFTVFNPVITVLDPTPLGNWEGCLSVPGMRGYVERPSRIQVDYLDEAARPAQVVASGFLATVFQHEFDHLDGVLYIDRLADPKLLAFNEEFDRYVLGQREGE